MIERASNSRLLAYLLGIAAVFVIIFGVRSLAAVLNPILLAIVITITVLPVPGRLSARGVPGWLAFVLTILLVVGILGLVIFTVILSVASLGLQLPTYIADPTSAIYSQLEELIGLSDLVSSTTQRLDLNLNSPLVQGVIASAFNVIVQFGLTLLIFFFMLSAAINLPDATRLGLDAQSPALDRVTGLTEDVRQYMTILTGINFLVGLGNTVLLLILGVDYAVLWGILSWFMGYIPSVGFLIALVPPLLMAYAEQGLTTAMIVLVGYIVINGGIQNFVQPKIMGDGLKLSPVVIFVSLFFWAFLLGGIGAILAVPLTLLVVSIMENFEATRNMAALMRFTGRAPSGEQRRLTQEAQEQIKGLWRDLRASFSAGWDMDAPAE